LHRQPFTAQLVQDPIGVCLRIAPLGAHASQSHALVGSALSSPGPPRRISDSWAETYSGTSALDSSTISFGWAGWQSRSLLKLVGCHHPPGAADPNE